MKATYVLLDGWLGLTARLPPDVRRSTEPSRSVWRFGGDFHQAPAMTTDRWWSCCRRTTTRQESASLAAGIRLTMMTLMAIATLSGCASLFNDKTPSVDVASNPEGASVYVNGNYVGETPVSVDLSVRKEHTITFRKEGYKEKTYQVSRSVGIG